MVHTICDIADRIKESTKFGTKVSVKRTYYSRRSTMERMVKKLSTSIEDQNQRHVPVTMLLVQAIFCL
jgi:hypothetical protein